jgi:predicted GNAT superfamily acetyltransferase
MSELSADDANRNRGKASKSLEEEVLQSDEEEATKRYTLDLPRSLHKQLKKQAVIEEERSMKEITIEALQDYLRRHE